jgi:hypothetical protein
VLCQPERLFSFSSGFEKFIPEKKTKAGTVYPARRFSKCRIGGHGSPVAGSGRLSITSITLRGSRSTMLGTLEAVQQQSRKHLRGIVESALARSMYFSGKNLRFEVHEDGVVLRGTVRSYYHKQLAQESLKSISGLPRIHNEIEVVTI